MQNHAFQSTILFDFKYSAQRNFVSSIACSKDQISNYMTCKHMYTFREQPGFVTTNIVVLPYENDFFFPDKEILQKELRDRSPEF